MTKFLQSNESSDTMATARQSYRDQAHREARDDLVLKHLKLVRRILNRLAADLPSGVDLENLEAAGVLGLMQAASQYDPSRNIPFATFAKPRIRGEILDELRRNSPLPQRVLANVAAVRRAMERLGFDASLELVAREAGLSESDIEEALQAMRIAHARSYDETDFLMYGVCDTSADQPDRPLEEDELRLYLADALEQLPEKERLIVTLYYYENCTLKGIGQILGLSESRVCRLLDKAELKLHRLIRQKTE